MSDKALQALRNNFDLDSDTTLKLASYFSAGHTFVMTGFATYHAANGSGAVTTTQRLQATTLDPVNKTFKTHDLTNTTKANI